MPRAFECWDLTDPPVPPRSVLFPLEPIGIGTPFVESLTSYISRLAEVHAATVSDLVGYVLAGCAPSNAPIISARARHRRVGSGFKVGTHAINGLAEDARRWIAAVETATDRSGLRFLTLMPLKQVFCKQSLFRRVQAWCPACFAEWRQNGLPLHLPLSWHLRMVSICVKHRRSLEEICPHCAQSFGPLNARARAGYCSLCRCWLGQQTLSRQEFSLERFHDDGLWAATCVGDVLASMPQLEESQLREILCQNIVALIRDVASANHRVFADITGSPGTAVGLWSNGRTRPRPDVLFQVCSRLRVPASKLLCRNATWEIPSEILAAGIAASRRGAWRDDPEQMKTTLLSALREEPPPSLSDIARRLSYKTCAALRRLDPSTCERIALRYRAYRRDQHNSWADGGRKCTLPEIEKILMESLAHERPIPASQIAARLGYESASPLRAHFRELCEAIARKQARNRAKSRELLGMAMADAISDKPPPAASSLAKRLGCSQGKLLHCFPDLYRRLLDAGRAWKESEREAIRMRIEMLAADMKGASVPEICRAAGVKQMFLFTNFPALYTQIASAYVARRKAQRQQRRAVLRDDVRRAITELSHKGVRPTVDSVIPFLTEDATRDWKRIQQEINDAMQKLG